MRKLTILGILLAVLILPLHAQLPQDRVEQRLRATVSAAIEKAQQARRRPVLPNDSPRNRARQYAYRALQRELPNWEDTENTFQLFPVSLEAINEANTQLSQWAQQRLPLFTQLTELLLNHPATSQLMRLEVQHPDYAKLTANYPYIFIGEHHGTTQIPHEVSYILSQIRRANPQARILLASEFAVLYDFEQSPLHAVNTPWQEIRPVVPNYEKVFTQATQLDMDVLALDDTLGSIDEEGVAVKIGKFLAVIDRKDPLVKPVLSSYQPQDDLQQFYALQDFLARSKWGVNERTKQWARYLNAVRPFYDIIIVYAGGGHLFSAEEGLIELPSLLNEAGFSISLYTDQEISQEDLTFYTQAGLLQESLYGACEVAEIEVDEQTPVCQQFLQAAQAVEEGKTLSIYGLNGQRIDNPQYRREIQQLMQNLGTLYPEMDVSDQGESVAVFLLGTN